MANALKIHLINHACVVFDAGDVRLLCDPWLSGSCFNDGWDLIVDNEVSISDLDFTHIWISHEHPDHFSPKDLQALPLERRQQTTIFYQQTEDKKVKDFCLKLGYSVIELSDFERFSISPTIFLTSAKSRGSDSWLLFESDDRKILNLNDCFIRNESELDSIKQQVGKIDVLMSQYSFANWIGNESDHGSQKRIAKMYLEIFARQVAVLKPTYVVPFANFTWFSSVENSYMNRFASKIEDAALALVDLPSKPVVLAPMDCFEIGTEPDNQSAITFWNRAYASLSTKSRRPVRSVAIETLREIFATYQNRIKEKNDWSAILKMKDAGNLPSADVYLTDHALAVQIDITDEFKIVDVNKEQCTIQISSDSLFFLLKHEWGRGTLQINGKFQANYSKLKDFIRQTQIAFANNIGLSYPDTISPDSVINPNTFVLRVAQGNIFEHL